MRQRSVVNVPALVLLIVPAFVWTLVAKPGLVVTTSGKTFRGEIAFTKGLIQVGSSATETQAVAASDLKLLKFELDDEAFVTRSQGNGNGLLGYYFSSTNFEGSVFVRLDETVNFDWGMREPAPGVQKDSFSVIWMGELVAPVSGDFTFHISADDGGRLYVGTNRIAVIASRPGGAEASGAMRLEAGQRYPIRFMYFDLAGNARAQLLWSSTNAPKSIIPQGHLYATSFLDDHKAEIQRGNGLLATYYSRPDFKGRTYTRLEPGIDLNFSGVNLPVGISNNFSVRWNGQLRADHAETYTFHALVDEGLRLWINDKLLINEWGQWGHTEYRQDALLEAGERYDLVAETRNNAGGAVARLLWSSASTAKALVPASRLYPSRPTASRQQASTDRTPPGVLLRNGTFISGAVERATDAELRLGGLLKNNPISTPNVARIYLQSLAKSSLARIQPHRTGALLARGDFMEGEFRGISNGQVHIASILFGLHKYGAKKDVLAVVLREAALHGAPFEIYLLDHSQLMATFIEFQEDKVRVHDVALGVVSIPLSEIAQIKHGDSISAQR
jgi:hypothetical protein